MKLKGSGVVIEDIQEYDYENKEESMKHKKEMEQKGYKAHFLHFTSREIGKPVFAYIKDITEEHQALNREYIDLLEEIRKYFADGGSSINGAWPEWYEARIRILLEKAKGDE